MLSRLCGYVFVFLWLAVVLSPPTKAQIFQSTRGGRRGAKCYELNNKRQMEHDNNVNTQLLNYQTLASDRTTHTHKKNEPYNNEKHAVTNFQNMCEVLI